MSLSTGQINRLNLAYILASSEAQYIFLDEPTANLDYENSTLFSDLIQHYKDNICFIIATHDSAFDNIATSVINI